MQITQSQNLVWWVKANEFWPYHVRFQPKPEEGPPWNLSSPRLGTCQAYERPTKLASSIMKKDKSEHARDPPPSFNSWYNQKGLCDHSKRKPNKNRNSLWSLITTFHIINSNSKNWNVDLCVLKIANPTRRLPIRSNGHDLLEVPTIEPHTIIRQSSYTPNLWYMWPQRCLQALPTHASPRSF